MRRLFIVLLFLSCAAALAQQQMGPVNVIGNLGATTIVSSKVSPIPFHSAIVISGDSICANTPSLRWTDLIMNMSQFAGRIDANHNTCVAGRTIEQVATAYATEVAIYKPSVTGISPTYLFVEAGTNSLVDGADTPAVAYAASQAYWAQALTDGFTVVAMTVIPRGASSGGAFTSNNIEAYNNLVRAGLSPGAAYDASPPSPALYSLLVDVNLNLTDPYEPTTFSVTNGQYTHPTYAGQRLFALAVNHFFGGPDIPAQNFNGRRGSYDFTCDFSGLPSTLNTGTFNTACGVKDLTANTSGNNNTALGASVLPVNTTGSFNTGIGTQALFQSTTGSDNTALGNDTLFNLVTGGDDTAVGFNALFNVTTGGNTAVGSNAGKNLTTGTGLTAVGYLADYLDATGNFDTAFGAQALQNNTAGNDDTGIGYLALNAVTASDDTGIGYLALSQDTTGANNTGVGASALKQDTTGANNTAVGFQAGYTGASGGDLTAVGGQAAQNTGTGADNTAIGFQSLFTTTTGANNTAVGATALFNTTASNNTAVGQFAQRLVTSGGANTTVGVQSLYNGATGANNVAVGYQAGKLQADGATALVPNNSVYLGYNTEGLNNSDSNSVVIGYQAKGLGANTTVLGSTATVATFLQGITANPSQAAVASAATIAPTTRYFHVTGTTAIVTITAPTACVATGFMCELTLIPDGLWTTTAAGNIALASTAVVSRALVMTYDPATSKWYPSY